MNTTELEEFTTGYADAEEDLIETGFDYLPVFNLLRHCKSLEPYEQGYLMCLQEHDDRLNVRHLTKRSPSKELNQ